MDSSWISSTKDNVFNYFYYHITSEDNRKIVETNAKEKRETDILVNKHDVIEATHSIRVMADMVRHYVLVYYLSKVITEFQNIFQKQKSCLNLT